MPDQTASLKTSLLADETELLLAFLCSRDAGCPRCGYNLRDLTRPVCPECEEPLKLSVGVYRFRFEWYLATIVPCVFSGLSAPFFTFVLVLTWVAQRGFAPWFLWATAVFGFLSGGVGITLFFYRRQFLRLTNEKQRAWAIAMWFVHLLIFILILCFIYGIF